MMRYTANSMVHPQHRHRSHTINPVVAAANKEEKITKSAAAVNLCGYDSYLHATICGGGHGHHNGFVVGNAVGVATPIRKKCNQKLIKNRLRHHQLSAAQQQQQHHHQQIHPLPQQQAMKLVHQEKQQRGGCRKAQQQQQQQQQYHQYHQRSLLMRRSKSKEELVTREKLNIVEGLLTTESFVDKLKITEDFAERHVQQEKQQVRVRQPTELILEYGSVPVTAEPGECERLLAGTPSEDVLTVISNNQHNELFIEEKSCPAGSQKVSPTHSTPKSITAGGVNRYGTHVHTHIHHHYHHFENEENVV